MESIGTIKVYKIIAKDLLSKLEIKEEYIYTISESQGIVTIKTEVQEEWQK